MEKNPTIVNFPVRNLELRDILPLPDSASAAGATVGAERVHGWRGVWAAAGGCGVWLGACIGRGAPPMPDRRTAAPPQPTAVPPPGFARSKYDLVANLVHDGKKGEGAFRAHVHRKVEEIWWVSGSTIITFLIQG